MWPDGIVCWYCSDLPEESILIPLYSPTYSPSDYCLCPHAAAPPPRGALSHPVPPQTSPLTSTYAITAPRAARTPPRSIYLRFTARLSYLLSFTATLTAPLPHTRVNNGGVVATGVARWHSLSTPDRDADACRFGGRLVVTRCGCTRLILMERDGLSCRVGERRLTSRTPINIPTPTAFTICPSLRHARYALPPPLTLPLAVPHAYTHPSPPHAAPSPQEHRGVVLCWTRSSLDDATGLFTWPLPVVRGIINICDASDVVALRVCLVV